MPPRIPGAREIHDPAAEAGRLAKARQDTPGREWGVRCATGNVARYGSLGAADHALSGTEGLPCGPHTVVCRDVSPWREASALPRPARW